MTKSIYIVEYGNVDMSDEVFSSAHETFEGACSYARQAAEWTVKDIAEHDDVEADLKVNINAKVAAGAFIVSIKDNDQEWWFVSHVELRS